MIEDAARRVELLLELYKQQMEHYHKTLEVEWKCNFGVWTLLAGAIYIVTKEHVSIPRSCAVSLVLVAATCVHGLWLGKIHHSEVADKKYWTRYRAEALQIIRGANTLEMDEKPWDRTTWQRMTWLTLEVMVTFLLCVFFFYSLPLSK